MAHAQSGTRVRAGSWLRRKRVLLWIALAAGAAAGAYFCVRLWPGDVDPADVRARAQKAAAAGDFAEAERLLDRWQAARPDDLDAHRARVDLWAQRDRLPEAIDAAREALSLRPDAGDLRERLAVWLFRVGRVEEADAECRRCRQARPDDPQMQFLQAEICRARGNNAEAERLVDGLLQAQPRAPAALSLRGALYLDAGQPDRAVPLLRAAAAQAGPGQRRARHFLTLALARSGHEEEARQMEAELRFQQTVEQWEKYGRSDSAAYQLSLAESLLRAGRSAEAVDLLERLLARTPDCAPAHRLLARQYEAQGRGDLAADHRRRAGD